jgi:hypothetical protein
MPVTAAESEAEKLSENTVESEHGANSALTIEVPLECVSVGNLTRIIDVKGGLICKALAVTNLQIEITENSVKFPWFSEIDSDSAKAYTHFISALCKMSKTQKRINGAEKPVENEKYAFRCFLLRLGFIGSEFKDERKILLKNLTGSAAFKGGASK